MGVEESPGIWSFCSCAAFAYIYGDDHRLEGEKTKSPDHFHLGVAGNDGTDGLFRFNRGLKLFVKLKLGLVVRLGLCRFVGIFFEFFDSRRYEGKVREQ